MNESLVFDITHLSRYAIITEPCTAIVKCNSKLDFYSLFDEDDHSRWLINLKAISADSLEKIKYLVSLDIKLKYEDVGYLLMKGAIWENQIKNKLDLPVKGEDVIATFDYVDDKLMCTAINILPKLKPELFLPSSELMEDINYFNSIINEK